MGGGGGSNFENELRLEQQKIMIQQVMFKLTELSFEKCVTKPSSSLSSSEKACIEAVATKYIDASEFVVGQFSGQR